MPANATTAAGGACAIPPTRSAPTALCCLLFDPRAPRVPPARQPHGPLRLPPACLAGRTAVARPRSGENPESRRLDGISAKRAERASESGAGPSPHPSPDGPDALARSESRSGSGLPAGNSIEIMRRTRSCARMTRNLSARRLPGKVVGWVRRPQLRA